MTEHNLTLAPALSVSCALNAGTGPMRAFSADGKGAQFCTLDAARMPHPAATSWGCRPASTSPGPGLGVQIHESQPPPRTVAEALLLCPPLGQFVRLRARSAQPICHLRSVWEGGLDMRGHLVENSATVADRRHN